jgi:LPPG:FO 2-phospho-L-lactate transferase
MTMKITALAGGVGGAKLAHGLAQILAPNELSVIVNTGDDFEHYGLHICPDLDTVCYTLAGLANLQTGWGREAESWQALENAQRLGGPGWFKLGDRDLGTHLERTRLLAEGEHLSGISLRFCQAWGIHNTVLPMSDQSVRTLVMTAEHGEIPFQEYFVKLSCEPRVQGFRFSGVESAIPAPGVLNALHNADAIVICPSNPWVSIDPILAIAGVRSAIEAKIVVAVSPIIGGKAVKGPVTKMYSELGIPPTALAVANHYHPILKGFIMDVVDKNLVKELRIPSITTDTLMNSLTKRTALAKDVLHFIGSIQTL